MIDIIKGHWSELLRKEEAMSKERLAICKVCPIMKLTSVGPICDKDLTLNPITNEISYEDKPGFTRGCNCRLNAKTRIPHAHCPVNKW